MKTNPTMNHPIHQLSALIGSASLKSLEQPRNWLLRCCVICGLTFLPLTLSAQNAVITSSTTENNENYQGVADNAALNVEGSGVTYTGTNITLNNTFDGGTYSNDVVGRGAYANNGGILFLTGGTITTSGTFGQGFILDNSSSGTANNVNIETHGYQANGVVARLSSTLTLTGGTITTNGYGAYALASDGGGNVTANNVAIVLNGQNNVGVRVASSTLALIGGNITASNTSGMGMQTSGPSNVTVNNTNIETTGQSGHGVYALSESTVTLADSNIRTTGSGASGILTTSTAHVIANLDGNTLSSTGENSYSIRALAFSTVDVTGSNGSVITGNVSGTNGTTIGINLSGEGTQFTGDILVSRTSTLNLSGSDGAVLTGTFRSTVGITLSGSDTQLIGTAAHDATSTINLTIGEGAKLNQFTGNVTSSEPIHRQRDQLDPARRRHPQLRRRRPAAQRRGHRRQHRPAGPERRQHPRLQWRCSPVPHRHRQHRRRHPR
jgi:hypothetical protein